MVHYSWRSTLLMEVCYTWRLCWWLGCFDWWRLCFGLLWWWFGCFDRWRLCYIDDLETCCLSWRLTWRQFLFYILLASWSFLPLRVGFLKPLLVGSKRIQVGSCEKSWCSYFSWCWENLRRLKCSAAIVSNGFYQYTIEFSIHIWCLLSMWLIYCYNAFMVNKCGICYIRTGYKKLLGKVRKIGRSVHTLIHPPSQCGCCVQQVFST